MVSRWNNYVTIAFITASSFLLDWSWVVPVTLESLPTDGAYILIFILCVFVVCDYVVDILVDGLSDVVFTHILLSPFAYRWTTVLS